MELGSNWIYPDTNVFDLVNELGIAHDTTVFDFDTLGLYDSGGELLEEEKSILVDETFLKDFVKYADKMANDETSWADIKQSYFTERSDLDSSKRQAINALVHTGISIEFGSPLNETNSGTTKEYLERGDWRNIEVCIIVIK